MRLSAPPFIHPCYFGTDVNSTENLIAAHNSIEDICKMIGADSISFLNVDYVDKLAEQCKRGFCKGCFTGMYPVEPNNAKGESTVERPVSAQNET